MQINDKPVGSIEPASDTEAGKDDLARVGKEIVGASQKIVSTVSKDIKKRDPNAEVDEDVAVAIPPTKPPTPAKAVTLAEKLSLPEIQPGEDLDKFLMVIQQHIPVPLDSLQTADQVATEQQEAVDNQMAPIVRETPAIMELVQQPTGKQILNAKFFEVHDILLNFNLMKC